MQHNAHVAAWYRWQAAEANRLGDDQRWHAAFDAWAMCFRIKV